MSSILILGSSKAAFARAPQIALTKNTLEGEKRSASARKAKMSVPHIKPSCTAESAAPIADVLTRSGKGICGMLMLPTNHSEVPRN